MLGGGTPQHHTNANIGAESYHYCYPNGIKDAIYTYLCVNRKSVYGLEANIWLSCAMKGAYLVLSNASCKCKNHAKSCSELLTGL